MIDLKSILQKYPESVKNKEQFRHILRDTYPEMSREVNIVVDVLEAGIALQIGKMDYLKEKDLKKYLSILEKVYGVSSVYGLSALYNWADGWGISYDQLEIKKDEISDKNITSSDDVFDINSVIYEDARIEMTYLGLELLGKGNPYGFLIKFIVQNKTTEKINFYDDILVVNNLGFKIDKFATSQAGYRQIIDFYVGLEECKYCGVRSIEDIHDLGFKLHYSTNDKKYYLDELKLKIVFI